MANRYLEKIAELLDKEAGIADMARKAVGAVTRNSKSLADDVGNLVKRPNKAFYAKAVARNPVAQAGAGALVGGAAVAATRKRDNDAY